MRAFPLIYRGVSIIFGVGLIWYGLYFSYNGFLEVFRKISEEERIATHKLAELEQDPEAIHHPDDMKRISWIPAIAGIVMIVAGGIIIYGWYSLLCG